MDGHDDGDIDYDDGDEDDDADKDVSGFLSLTDPSRRESQEEQRPPQDGVPHAEEEVQDNGGGTATCQGHLMLHYVTFTADCVCSEAANFRAEQSILQFNLICTDQ